MAGRVSVITVNLNNAKGLEKTIESVFAQKSGKIEYIIIDGGSIDGSLEIIEAYESQITYWVSEPDEGIYNAMNKGWKKATGDFCLFLNSGDLLFENNTIELAVNFLTDSNTIYFGDIVKHYGTHHRIEVHPEVYDLYVLTYKNLPHQGCFIPRQLLITLNGYDEKCRVISDYLFYNQAIIDNNTKFQKLPNIISVFDMSGISSTTKYAMEVHDAFERHYPFLIDVLKVFKRLRHYELSRAHRVLEKILHFGRKLKTPKV